MGRVSLGQPDYLAAFIKTAQYLAALTTATDVWAESARLLVSFWGADLGGFGERPSDGEIVIRHWTFSAELFTQMDFVSEAHEDIAEVLDGGFLTWRFISSSPEPLVVAFLPITQKNQVTRVLLVGHRTSGLLAKSLLNTYLAFAGLVGTTAERLASEVELRKHRRHLEELVGERTAQLTKTNERLKREIIQRQRAEEVLKAQRDALRESEEKYRCFFNNAEVGMFRARSDSFEILDMNEKFLKIFKCAREEMRGSLSTIHWVDPYEWEEMVRRLNTVGRVTDFEFTMLNKLGEVRVCVTSLRLYREQGILEGSITDITERKLAEKALQEAKDTLEVRVQERTAELESAEKAVAAERQRLYDILETMPIMVSLLTPDYRVVFANRSFREKFGEDSGRKCFDYRYGRKEPCEFCETYQVFKTGESHHWESTGPDGSIIDAHDFPFTDADGSRLILEMDIDITDRKRAEADLIRSNEDLQQFAYIASHDLQEPLRNVASCVRMLEKKYKNKLDGDADQYIRYAVEGAARMKALIQDLLAYSRVGTKGKPPEPTDFERILAGAVKNLKSAITDTGAVITHDALPTIPADDTQISQVFQNLIANAIKFHKDDSPRIHVSAVKNEHEWIISVKDNGIGIEPRHWDRIFMIFQRLNRRTEYDGTGMGLAIVKKVVERHGGRVWLESYPGKGTTFYFAIPEEGKRR